jgi:ABC-type nitrate/sulfonate/bicarbonate transport system ATPase subunit
MNQEALHVIATLNSRALRAERAQEKLGQELVTTREALKQVTNELQETVRLADLLYEVSQRTGTVADYLLKEHNMKESHKNSASFEVILKNVMKQIESQGSENCNREAEHEPRAEASSAAELGS